ncbi:MAG: DUF1801 domain-containing protein [Saprospiraceae bacterium]|nr:DUF1801 domain-containing protein [Saprospiraceae bacterium]
MSTNPFQISTNPQVVALIESYPSKASSRLMKLRNLIFETASDIDGLDHLEETLKWGEPSYITKKGSTLRMDWKSKNPDQYALYFSCSTKLVSTFREVFKSDLTYEGNRAVIFNLNAAIPEDKVRVCIKTALIYKRVKDIERLGISS